jgi:hypothetical protein
VDFLKEEKKSTTDDLSNMYPTLKIEYDEYCGTVRDFIEPMSFEDFVEQSQESPDSQITPIVPMNFF